MTWTDGEMIGNSDQVTYNDMGKQTDLHVLSTFKLLHV